MKNKILNSSRIQVRVLLDDVEFPEVLSAGSRPTLQCTHFRLGMAVDKPFKIVLPKNCCDRCLESTFDQKVLLPPSGCVEPRAVALRKL